MKHQEEQAQGMFGLWRVEFHLHAGDSKRGGHIDLEKFLGTRAGILPVKPPHRAVGQHAPLYRPVGDNIDT
jgi:hypothetical protein